MKSIQWVAVALLSFFAALSFAGEVKHYSQAEFDQLTGAGKGVVVVVHAPWCPTCKVQDPIQRELMSQPAYKDVTMLVVDFDSEKPVLQKFKINMQSAMLAFKGSKEMGRSVGDASRAGIETMFKKTL